MDPNEKSMLAFGLKEFGSMARSLTSQAKPKLHPITTSTALIGVFVDGLRWWVRVWLVPLMVVAAFAVAFFAFVYFPAR